MGPHAASLHVMHRDVSWLCMLVMTAWDRLEGPKSFLLLVLPHYCLGICLMGCWVNALLRPIGAF